MDIEIIIWPQLCDDCGHFHIDDCPEIPEGESCGSFLCCQP